MGNWNPNYFEKKAGSLEEAILNAVNGVKTQINEDKVVTDLEDDPKLFKDIAKMGVKVKKLGKPEDGYVEVELSGPKAKIDAANKKLNLLPESKIKEGSKEEYKKFFDGAMKKFGIDSPADLKSDEEKKKFFDYVDKNYKGEKDEAYHAKIKEWSGMNEADDFKTHMMYDPKTGKGYEAKTMDDHLRMKKMGYGHEKPKMDEAMKGFKVEFGKGNDAGMAVYKDKKDAEAFAKRQPKPIKITQIDVKNANMFDDPNPTRKEAYELGTKEYTAHTKKVTPGQFESQGEADWNETVSNIHKKQTSMREALAKVWGFDEGKSPFDTKEEKKTSKKEGKTMTGKPMTKVDVEPDMKEKKN